MHFKPMLLLLGLAASVSAQISAPELTANLHDLARKSRKAREFTNDISPVNFYDNIPKLFDRLEVINEIASNAATSINGGSSKRSLETGGDVADPGVPLGDKQSIKVGHDYINVVRWREIANTLNQTVGKKRQSPPAYSDSQQKEICSAYGTFTLDHQKLLRSIAGKSGMIKKTSYKQPLRSTLRSLQHTIDELGLAVIDNVPTCAENAAGSKKYLDKVFETTIKLADR